MHAQATGTGGSNGATMRYAPESEHGANAGLAVARCAVATPAAAPALAWQLLANTPGWSSRMRRKVYARALSRSMCSPCPSLPPRSLLEPIKAKYPWISYADLWTLAGVVAIESMGGEAQAAMRGAEGCSWRQQSSTNAGNSLKV